MEVMSDDDSIEDSEDGRHGLDPEGAGENEDQAASRAGVMPLFTVMSPPLSSKRFLK